jgi:cytochrome c556
MRWGALQPLIATIMVMLLLLGGTVSSVVAGDKEDRKRRELLEKIRKLEQEKLE